MSKILPFAFAAALLALGSAALAQTVGAAKPISRTDYVKTIDGHFAAIDSNHDGSISKAELAAEQQRELAQVKANVAQQIQAKFKQLDTNRDGQLSLAEFMAAAPPLHIGETADQMLQRFDANHDGKITAEEFSAPQLARFSKVDANHDGVVTPREMQAAGDKK